jgi:hypothetical protein
MPFQKGQSGNPRGRPKESPELKALARQHTPEAFERLLFWMRSDNPKASVTSALHVIERAYGKPEQPLVGADGEALSFVMTLGGQNS